jgi:hypothetical protein
MADAHEPRRAVQYRAEVVAAALVRGTGVQSHAGPQRAHGPPLLSFECDLRLDRCGHGRRRGRKHGMKSVTGALDHDAAVSGHSVGEQLVVARQRDLHFIGLLFPQLGRALEIGEQERHRSGGQLAHSASHHQDRSTMPRRGSLTLRLNHQNCRSALPDLVDAERTLGATRVVVH